MLQARPTQHFFGDVRDGILPSHRSSAARRVVAIDSRQGTPNTLSVGDFHTRRAGSDMVRAGLPLGTRLPRCAHTPSTAAGQTKNEGIDAAAGPAPNPYFKTVGGVTWHDTRNPQDWEMRTLGYASADMRGRDTPARVRWHASGDHWNPKEEHTELRRTGRSVKIGWYALCHGETLHVDEEHIYVHQVGAEAGSCFGAMAHAHASDRSVRVFRPLGLLSFRSESRLRVCKPSKVFRERHGIRA